MRIQRNPRRARWSRFFLADRKCALLATMVICLYGASAACAQTTQKVVLRGQEQTLSVYGRRGSDPVIVSSGDGGWVHLAPHVAEALASKGFFVLGFDTRAYLASFTSGKVTLGPEQEQRDYEELAELAAGGTSRKPILIGVSEGAGLSVLAASNPQTKSVISGVIALGLPDLNELGWRWKDSLIYLTHSVPNEPTFRTAAIIGKIAPIPLAAIHSSRDEFVSVNDIQRLIEAAGFPKKLWIVNASNHRFGGNLAELDQRLLEAVTWVARNSPR